MSKKNKKLNLHLDSNSNLNSETKDTVERDISATEQSAYESADESVMASDSKSLISFLSEEAKSELFQFDDTMVFIEESNESLTLSTDNESQEDTSMDFEDASSSEENPPEEGTFLEEQILTEVTSTPEDQINFSGSELESFESAQIEELDFISDEQLQSTVESILFASDRPVSLATIKQVFQGTNINNARIKHCIENLKSHYASPSSGVTLEDVGSGYQLRTKLDNMEFLRRSLKAKPFKLSGPALEVLAIVAYKQPTVKHEIDEIRGVESGHLLRALMEKNLVHFAGKSDLPGKPMQYVTSRKFLEIFSLRNLKELPTLSQIDELLPEGIGEEEIQKPKLHDLTDHLSQKAGATYSEGEEELNKITDQLQAIETSSDFFEQEKLRQKEQKEAEKAQNIREAMGVGEEVSTRDKNWLKKYEERLLNPVLEVATVESNENLIFKDESIGDLNVQNSEADNLDDIPSWADPEILEDNDLADIDN